ncbi:DUF5327 family protein [Geomicrobium sp. JCM 19038]|uniref:DUF5327 family protein n=1 Tax=Geomicrobium sp. JCM 19038 TaxID=1460635 RepID=UPI00045F167B|nr:DUF5327 family protein [Geomicrobium sp. JCM 19038]GAK06954.1 hypothetical protein JCM19038_668 [Geomicrobium sp. JCM 19038]
MAVQLSTILKKLHQAVEDLQSLHASGASSLVIQKQASIVRVYSELIEESSSIDDDVKATGVKPQVTQTQQPRYTQVPVTQSIPSTNQQIEGNLLDF